MSNLQHKAFLSICLLVGYFVYAEPACFSQSFNQSGSQTGTAPALGQSDWQTLNQSPNQQYQSSPSLGQSDWQTPGANSSGFNQTPGLTANQANNVPSTGQSAWQTPNQSGGQAAWQNPSSNPGLGASPWQQPQNTVQANVNQNPNSQQNSDYYYGQVNQNQQNPYAFNNGQYQGQANSSAQPNNQWSSNLPPASSIPAQQAQTQNPQGGGLKKTLAGITKAAAQAAGMGMGVAAPLAGVYMMNRAMTNTVPSYGYPGGYPGAMPYGYGGYSGMSMPYAAPNYAMMNMAPMYSSAFSGLSSFMNH